MENLISKWKNAQNSLKKDKPSSRLSSTGKNQYAFSSSSSSDETSPQQKANNEKNRYLLPTKTEVTATSYASNDQLSNRMNVVSPPKKTEKKNFSSLQTPEAESYSRQNQHSGKKNGTPTSHHEKSDKKTSKNAPRKESIENENTSRQPSQPSKKGIPFLIDQASYKIMDIFKYNSDLSNQEKLQRVKRVVEDVVDSASSKTEELETQINNLRQETKRMSLMSRNDASSKIVSELEARLCESEREKMQLKKEKDQLANQLNSSNKENELSGTNSELIKLLTKNQQILEENNQQLLRQIQEANRREEEQQFIWQNEVNDLTEILKLLKEQLMTNQTQSL